MLDANASLAVQGDLIQKRLKRMLPISSQKLDAIVNVAGGWSGGNAASPRLLANADLLWRQSMGSSLLAASVAARFFQAGGLLILPGALSALNSAPTPSMLAYGAVKTAVHQLTKSLALDKSSGLPATTCVLALLPDTLDTPMNRRMMPNADLSKWTPLEFVTKLVDEWITNASSRPTSGSFVQLITENYATSVRFD